MNNYEVFFTKQAAKDVSSLSLKLKDKLERILKQVIMINPFSGKKLLGPLKGNYSYRLSLKDRIIYSVDQKSRIIYIKRARTHYGE